MAGFTYVVGTDGLWLDFLATVELNTSGCILSSDQSE